MSTEQTTEPQASSEEPQEPQGTNTPEEGQQTPQEDVKAGEEDTALAKLRKEAAGHRVAAKEARTEADTLRSQLTAAQDAILAGKLEQSGVTLDALRAAGHRDSAFNEDGTINADALATAIQDTTARFGTTRRSVPDSLKGRETPPGVGNSRSGGSWADLLREG